jgi:hypothetical protein
LRGWEVYAPHYVRLGKLSNVLPSAEHDPAHAKRQRKAHSRDNKAPKVVQRVIVGLVPAFHQNVVGSSITCAKMIPEIDAIRRVSQEQIGWLEPPKYITAVSVVDGHPFVVIVRRHQIAKPLVLPAVVMYIIPQ